MLTGYDLSLSDQTPEWYLLSGFTTTLSAIRQLSVRILDPATGSFNVCIYWNYTIILYFVTVQKSIDCFGSLLDKKVLLINEKLAIHKKVSTHARYLNFLLFIFIFILRKANKICFIFIISVLTFVELCRMLHKYQSFLQKANNFAKNVGKIFSITKNVQHIPLPRHAQARYTVQML